ncbi:MAG: MgtC/SapB family protein [Gammaproteobacteria bacterium]
MLRLHCGPRQRLRRSIGIRFILTPSEASHARDRRELACPHVAIVGVEREKKIKPAGLRTMILIALGSALFTMISVVMADHSGDKG